MTHNIEIGCMLDKDSAEVLYNYLIQLPKKGRLVETGTGWGHSSKFFSEVLPGWIIYTIDGFGLYGDGRIYPAYDSGKVKDIIDNHSENVIQVIGRLPFIKWELPIDVLYLDADHSYWGCRAEYLRFSEWLKPGGLLIFDDYIQDNNPNNEVKRVVDEIEDYAMLYKGMMAIMRKL